ncbi:hypothetical protein ACFFLS_20020 [Flavobacterium procerum]|uniref:DUF4468 domain-containing protein n=1 Tax=Flavobacterium procerum TaxID=1455569 RepID=A0ABV6BV77_9FLAO
MYLKSTYFLLLFTLFSCAGTDYTVYPIVNPVDVNPKSSTWLIDEAVLNINGYYSTEIIDAYKKILPENFGTVKSIRDYNSLSTINIMLKGNSTALAFYKEKTNCDYVIETEMKSVQNNLPVFQLHPDKSLTDELYIRIMVYNLKSNELVYDKEYRFYQTFTGGNDIAFSDKTEKFYKNAIKATVKDFAHKNGWKSKTK